MTTLTCTKVPHLETGYLHEESDDSPYDVDGCLYCGRCHRACDGDGRCSEPSSAAANYIDGDDLAAAADEAEVARMLEPRFVCDGVLAISYDDQKALSRRLFEIAGNPMPDGALNA